MCGVAQTIQLVAEWKLLSLCPHSQNPNEDTPKHKALVLSLCTMQSFLEGHYFSVLAVTQCELCEVWSQSTVIRPKPLTRLRD